MTTTIRERPTLSRQSVATRGDACALIRRHCRDAGAHGYLLAEAPPDEAGAAVRIVASDWRFDTVEDVGLTAIARLIESPVATFPGTTPRGWDPFALAALLSCDEIGALGHCGHEEIFLLKLPAGRRRFAAIVSADTPGRVDTGLLRRAQMACCHMLSRLKSAQAAAAERLSERERECLFWVSEGKTAEEVALILDVSTNTVNSYVAHAIHKLSASNRAMAIAAAIRQGLI